MKLIPIVCFLLASHFSIQAQTIKKSDERFLAAKSYSEQKATDNYILTFYTKEEIQLANVTIPTHTIFSANVRLNDGRAFVKVSKIKIDNEVYNVDWRIIGPDYNEGIPLGSKNKSIELFSEQDLTFKVF